MSAAHDRFLFLLDWARRDRTVGLAQARLDEARFPGIRKRVEDCLALHEELAQRRCDWRALLVEITRMRSQP